MAIALNVTGYYNSFNATNQHIEKAFSKGSSVAFIDTVTVRKIQLSTQRRIRYGRQRMFASFGGTFGITLTNLTIDFFLKAQVTFNINDFLYRLCFGFVYPGISFTDRKSGTDIDTNSTADDKDVFREILFKTLRRFDVAFFT